MNHQKPYCYRSQSEPSSPVLCLSGSHTPFFSSHLFLTTLTLSLLLFTAGCAPQGAFEFEPEDRIAIVGNALGDRMQHDGWLETYLQALHPEHQLVFRNLAISGDQVHHRPRAHEDFGDADSHLSQVQASVIFAFFGYNESYDDNPEQFAERLSDWIDHTRTQRYDGIQEPDIILFSPIAHEDLETHNLPDGSDNNRRLDAYTRAMAEVADAKEVLFVDLFELSGQLYQATDEPLTINGIHLTTEGNRQIARVITEALSGTVPQTSESELGSLREAVLDKNWHWFNRYRAPSGNDVWGSRAELHGNRETLQHELLMIDVMTKNRDRAIWAAARGEEPVVDDSNVPPPLTVESNYTGGEITYLGGEEAIEQMTLPQELNVNLFASEEMFPELINPVQMQVDPQGRLWVAAWATYPKWEPMKEMNDRLIVLEDTNGDGVADQSTTFAYVHNPTGFELWNDGVIVVSAPNILYLKDTTGDGVADKRVILFTGLDSADTHHTANNLIYGPDGYIYYQRGVFHLHNVESPRGKSHESRTQGLYRFNPRTFEFDFHTHNSPNPHGISFDRWGYHYITDATSGSAFQVFLDGNVFDKRPLLNHTVRPVPGNYVLSSGHFPDSYDNNFLILNTIGFLGIKRYDLSYETGIARGEEIGDLISSTDPNFRPTDSVVGADGALYVSDWHNPTVGHMQHNLREPIRDHSHGRIYRITAEGNPPLEPVSIYGEPVDHLLDLLQHPEHTIRERARTELSGRNTDELIPAAQVRAEQLDPRAEDHALPLLELLWLHQQHNIVNRRLLDLLLDSPVEHVRIAAERVEWFWSGRESLAGHPDPTDPSIAYEMSSDRTGEILDLTGDETAVLTITALVEQMRYDIAEFSVNTGQTVELTFDNPDFMPHNLLIVNPGTADEIAEQAVAMGGEGFALQFIPDNPNVLHATSMLNNRESELLTFTAPSEPGEYPFVCTFPGHSILMRGVMKVVTPGS